MLARTVRRVRRASRWRARCSSPARRASASRACATSCCAGSSERGERASRSGSGAAIRCAPARRSGCSRRRCAARRASSTASRSRCGAQKLRARVLRNAGGRRRRTRRVFLGELIGAPFPTTMRVELRAARQDPLLMARPGAARVRGLPRGRERGAARRDRARGSALGRPADACGWSIRRCARSPDRPLFVLALARPEVHELFPRLWAERGAQEIGSTS